MHIEAVVLHPFFVLSLIFVPVGLLVWLAIAKGKEIEKKRSEDLKRIAAQSGFSYSDALDIDLNSVPITMRVGGGDSCNMFKTVRRDVVWRIFDYRTGGGRNRRCTTVIMAESPRSFPAFILSERNRFDILAKLFGFHAIEFDKDQPFSKLCFLIGNDDTGIRNVFDQKVIRHFETCKLCGTIRAEMNMVFHFQLGKTLTPEERPLKLEEAEKVLSVFLH